jgi:hypothetical protein
MLLAYRKVEQVAEEADYMRVALDRQVPLSVQLSSWFIGFWH